MFFTGNNQIAFAFAITLLAGLSTGVGGLLVIIAKKINAKMFSMALGFSAGIMIYVSMIELFPDARDSIISELGAKAGMWATVCSFFAGIFLIAIIDKLIPSYENPHEMHDVNEMLCGKGGKLLRVGLLTALAIAIHNLPEGMATLISAINDPKLGVTIAAAIAIHNIPEGLAVSIPIYCATGSRKKAFLWTILSGLAEPAGAIIGYSVLYRWMNGVALGISFAAVAGIMMFISLDELLPAAREYGEHHLSIYGLIAGMLVMAIWLILV